MAPVIALILFALLLVWLSGRLRGASGVPEGALVYTDSGAWQRNEKPLFSRAHQLSGKPDYLVRDGDAMVPVEVKSSRAPDQPRYGHVLQLAAYCLLVEESLGARVERGILKYADRQFVIDYTPALRAELLGTLDAMRADLAAGGSARSHRDPRRCLRCGVREECDERLRP